MKKKYKFIGGVLIMLFIVVSVYLSNYFYNLNVIKDDLNQAELLKDISLELLKEEYIDVSDSTVNFAEGSLRNFITYSKFNEDCQNLLENIETVGNDLYEISVEYISKSHILLITLQSEDGNYKLIQKYKIFVKNGKIMYEKYGEPEEIELFVLT